MMNFMRFLSCMKLALFSLTILLPVFSYTQDCSESKYLAALLAIRTSLEINEEIKRVFPRATRKRDEYVDFLVSENVEYLALYDFFGDKAKSFIIDSLGLESSGRGGSYDRKNQFESYRIPCLGRLMPPSESVLILTFSEPKDDYVIAEFLDARYNKSIIKMGQSLQILFLFDDKGLVRDVKFSARLYN